VGGILVNKVKELVFWR